MLSLGLGMLTVWQAERPFDHYQLMLKLYPYSLGSRIRVLPLTLKPLETPKWPPNNSYQFLSKYYMPGTVHT